MQLSGDKLKPKWSSHVTPDNLGSFYHQVQPGQVEPFEKKKSSLKMLLESGIDIYAKK